MTEPLCSYFAGSDRQASLPDQRPLSTRGVRCFKPLRTISSVLGSDLHSGPNTMTDVDFTKRMRNAQVEDLVMITTSDGFEPTAVEAAKAELERRNLGQDNLARFIKEDAEERQQDHDIRAAAPLSTMGKIAFLFFGPAFLWSVLAAFFLARRGYHRKSVDAFKWIAISLGIWFCVIVLVGKLA